VSQVKFALYGSVKGRVQGVFFRAEARLKATQLGLSGWVRNRLEGDVEIHIQGTKEQMDAMGDWLQQGPPKAQVIEVNLKPVSLDESLSGFEIRS